MAEILKKLLNVPIFAVGTWNSDVYGEADLDAMVSAYAQVGWRPPVKLGHDPSQPLAKSDGMPALGWVANLRRVGKTLFADLVDLPGKVHDAIARKAYDKVSAEVYWDYADGGKKLPRVLKALALLGADIPAVTSLAALSTLYAQPEGTVKVYDFGMKEIGEGWAVPQTASPAMAMGVPAIPKKCKAEAGYAQGRKDKLASCGACKFFLGPPTLGDDTYLASCGIVEGEIASSFGCKLQEVRDAFSAGDKMVEMAKSAAVKAHESVSIPIELEVVVKGTNDVAAPGAGAPGAEDLDGDEGLDQKLTIAPDEQGQFCVMKGIQKVQCFPTEEEANALLSEMTVEGEERKADARQGGPAQGADAELGPDGKPTPKLGPDGKPLPDEELGPDGKPIKKKQLPPWMQKKGGKPFAFKPRARSYAIQHRGSKWVLLSKMTGKVLGEHGSYEEAQAQELAIQASKNHAQMIELTADQMAPLCPSCADKMRADNIRAYRFHLGPVKVYGVEVGKPLGRARYFAVGPNADALCEKFGADEGFFTRCVEHMGAQKGIDDANGFCAELHNHCVGKYPGEKKAAERKPARTYAVRAAGREWDVLREPDGEWVGTYATEAEAAAAKQRLEEKFGRPFEYEFDESKHPRGVAGTQEGGRFVAGGGGELGGGMGERGAGRSGRKTGGGVTQKQSEQKWEKWSSGMPLKEGSNAQDQGFFEPGQIPVGSKIEAVNTIGHVGKGDKGTITGVDDFGRAKIQWETLTRVTGKDETGYDHKGLLAGASVQLIKVISLEGKK